MSLATLEQKKAVVRSWIDEVFNGKDLRAVDRLKVSSYLDWTPFPTQRLDLPVSGLKHSLPTFLTSLPDLRFEADEMTAEGDFVVCLGRWRATHARDYLGVPATGRRVGGSRIDIFRVVGDKMIEHWGCGNELAFLQMLGTLDGTRQEDEAGQDVRVVARRFVERVLNQRDLAAVAEGVNDQAVDRGNLTLTLFLLLTAFSDYRVEVEDIVAEGETVTVLSTYTGTHQGRYCGVAPTGRQVRGTRTDTVCVRQGSVVEVWHDWDNADLLRQLTA